MSNLKVVQEIYIAFGQGNIPGISEHMAEEVDWEYAYRQAPNPVPWLQPRDGKAGVAQFFESLGALEFHQFVPKVLLEGPDLVVALIDLEATVKKTGKRIVERDEVHIWHFGEAGKVVRFRHCVDTYQHALAYTP
ncbi:MAG: nuclear transport factor 2 family protein [Caldilineaceae bacterium]|mgnify:CR=1 FL=1|nr:nuclear transport factor 2 family protein [Caldilineaceae bacterium]